jgi:hypothetical protein
MADVQVNPWLQRWFNITAGLEKAIIAIASACQAWVASFPEDGANGWTPADKTLVIAMIGVVQIIYTANTVAVPPNPVETDHTTDPFVEIPVFKA